MEDFQSSPSFTLEKLRKVRDNILVKEKRQLRVLLPDSTVVEGNNFIEVKRLAHEKGYGDDGIHYLSESHQSYIKIVDMDSQHIRNALFKLMKEEIEALKEVENIDLPEAVSKLHQSKTISTMLQVLMDREPF